MNRSHGVFYSVQSGMTLLEVLVGFVIFSASLVAILNYVSNQVYLNHLTESNQVKMNMIKDYADMASVSEEQRLEWLFSQNGLNLQVETEQVDSFKKGRDQLNLVQKLIQVEENGVLFKWAILELN